VSAFIQPDTSDEVDPFVKRVVTVHPEDRVIFRVLVPLDPEEMADIKAKLEAKMGAIPILVIGPDIDLTVLKPPKRTGSSEVMIA